MSLFGICSERINTERALDTLRTAGFRSTDVSVLFADSISGEVSDGMLTWLAGIGALSIPGVGPFIAAGPIMGMLGGVGTSASIGGLLGALMALGIPEYDARVYERRIRTGAVLVSVYCGTGEWERRARSVLEQHGAEDISRNSEPM